MWVASRLEREVIASQLDIQGLDWFLKGTVLWVPNEDTDIAGEVIAGVADARRPHCRR